MCHILFRHLCAGIRPPVSELLQYRFNAHPKTKVAKTALTTHKDTIL